MKERWRDVDGWEGLYKVSNLGRVKAMERTVTYADGRVFVYPERLMSYRAGAYPQVRLSSHGRARTYQVHALVATAFCKKPPDADRVCHRDDDPTNPAASNLYWGNASTNTVDSYANQKRFHKITLRMVDRARKMRSKGMTFQDIADSLGMSKKSAINIIHGRHRFETV